MTSADERSTLSRSICSLTTITSCRASRPLYPVLEQAEQPTARCSSGTSSPGVHGNAAATNVSSVGT